MTKAALEKSIEHWERNAAGLDDGIDTLASALCDAYFFSTGSCRGCPVSKATDGTNCNAPLEDASYAYCMSGPTSEQFKAAAQQMVEFLKTLREQYE